MFGNWKDFLFHEFKKPYFQDLKKFINQAYQNNQCLPLKKNLFRAFSLCPKNQTKIVILGQDPYFQINQANGLAFSVNRTIVLPPSLKNIFSEIKNCYPETILSHGDLTNWARQGILLLNTSLTVAPGEPASHSSIGWEIFTNNVLLELADNHKFIIFVLWGKQAQNKKKLLTLTPQHTILESAHPSPLSASRGFFDSQVFLKINQTLTEHKLKSIQWDLS